ncbi:MAG: tetratricopeptide repeat protein [Verrucomicrobiota bacterium]
MPAGITVWHRNQGVFIAKGAGIEATDEIYGAGLLDITPTILRLFDLPIGKDMEGRVLLEALTEKSAIESIPSWEKTPAKPKRRGSLSPEESEALLEQFVALGYINDIAADSTEAATETRVENQWSLARSLLYSGQHESALPLLEDCHVARPDRTDFAQALARTQLALGLKTEAEETLGICLRALGDTTAAYILQAHIAYEKGDHEEAIAHLETARAQSPQSVPVLELSCRAYVILKRWQEAWDTAELLLSIDPSSIQAHNILTRCHLRKNNPEAAVETALAAIGLRFSSPRAHQLLGRALIELGRWEEAEHALHNALRFDLSDIQTLQALKTVYEHKGEIAKAMEFEGAITTAQFIDHQAEIRRLDSLRDGIAARAKKRHAERRASEKKTPVLDTKDQPLREMEFTLVSGLPRSGTSLMMQVLRAGGMELMHDGKRVADEDNPEGYWEWEGVKSLKQNPRLIEQAEGKVIKVISALLGHLPTSHRYRIVFMKRPAEEVVASQLKMLARNGLKPRSEREHLIQTQRTHLDQTLARLQNLKHVELLEVDYPDLVSAPEGTLQALEDFFGSSLPIPQNMSAVIRPELYRNQSS